MLCSNASSGSTKNDTVILPVSTTTEPTRAPASSGATEIVLYTAQASLARGRNRECVHRIGATASDTVSLEACCRNS